MRSTVVKTDVPGEQLPWRKIGWCAASGAALGLIAVGTTAGVSNWAIGVASYVDVTAGMAIMGGLWAATFFSPDH